MPDGSSEMLMVIDQQVIDPARRARGETGTMRRFVHQFHLAGRLDVWSRQLLVRV